MKTIEERADAYVGHPFEIDEFSSTTAKRQAFIDGAKEQKVIDDEMLLKKWDDMTEEEYNREIAFVDWYLKNGNGAPTFSDAIEWARKEFIEKACEWLSDYFVFKHEAMSAQGCDAFLKKFRSAMEE